MAVKTIVNVPFKRDFFGQLQLSAYAFIISRQTLDYSCLSLYNVVITGELLSFTFNFQLIICDSTLLIQLRVISFKCFLQNPPMPVTVKPKDHTQLKQI